MSIRTTQFTAGQTTYDISPFTASRGLSLLQRLLKVIGPAAAAAIGSSLESEDGAAEIETAAFGSAVELLMKGLGEEDLAQLVQDLISDCTIKGQPIAFETQYAGNYGELSRVLLEVLKVNYSSFFAGSDFASLVATARDRIST